MAYECVPSPDGSAHLKLNSGPLRNYAGWFAAEAVDAQKRSNASVRSLAIASGSRRSISLRCSMNTGLPAWNKAIEGDEGGKVATRLRTCAPDAACAPP